MMTNWVQWILSATSLTMLYFMGRKARWAPFLGIANQVLWFYYVITTEQWGLLPGVIAYTVIHILNAWKWMRE